VFRTTVISYLIDDYRDNLSDEDYDNFPYDEVYNFLLNHFYDKIKDRYVEVFGGDIQESIRRILSEETQIPSVIRRRVSSDDIEEAFDYALEENALSMYKPNSIIYKGKENTTLWVFSKFVIDDMVTLIEQEYFNDDNRIYFSDNEEDTEKYHEQIRKPLLRHYGDRIKERYNEVKSDNINETVNKSKFFHRRILREDEYSPAGKEIIPNKIVIHKSNPKFRDRISNEGLKARAGECYKIYAGYGEKCIPAIFATNSTNKRAWFDSTYDDDVWTINTEMMPDVKWYKDRHYESTKKHIVTFNNIPPEAIELLYEGTGGDSF
jgi:hypothetical protein